MHVIVSCFLIFYIMKEKEIDSIFIAMQIQQKICDQGTRRSQVKFARSYDTLLEKLKVSDQCDQPR